MATDYKKRVGLVEEELQKIELDSFLVSNEINVRYLTGFKGSDSSILFAKGKRFFITDSRYLEEARAVLSGFTIELVKSSTYEALKKISEKVSLKRMGFESMNLPYDVAIRLKKIMGGVETVPLKNVVESIRIIKNRSEVSLIKKSIRLAKTVLTDTVKKIRPGVSEESLRSFAEISFLENGASAGFEPIIACGKNASKPHAKATAMKIPKDAFVMIDMGCNLDGYNSDVTRTLMFGNVNSRFKKIYDVVKTAQEKAFKKIRPGAKIPAIDNAARSYICEKGYGDCFSHSLGHGVGLEVHEAPNISEFNNDILRPGMVFTIEPAIYIPGFGGVRIEDMVLVTERGCEVLTKDN